MADFLQVLSTLREQMSANLSRSDVLRPLAWLIGILLTALLGLAIAQAEATLITAVTWAFCAAVVLYLVAYVYCLFCDRDALRSEKYSLSKLAIQHGLYGDSRIGLVEEPKKGTGTGLVVVDATASSAGSDRE